MTAVAAKETLLHADWEILRHTLGIGDHISKREWGYRNYFNAEEGHSDFPSLQRLVAGGLMVRSTKRPDYWYATREGMLCAGLPQAKINKLLI